VRPVTLLATSCSKRAERRVFRVRLAMRLDARRVAHRTGRVTSRIGALGDRERAAFFSRRATDSPTSARDYLASSRLGREAEHPHMTTAWSLAVMTQTKGWILTALFVFSAVTLAEAQVPTAGSNPKRSTGTQSGGKATTGTMTPSGPSRTNPSPNPFENPIMQPLPPATSTVNPQQNYPPVSPPVGR
jgi:hypothetical protein